jgi:hypothetical protein
MSHEPVHSAVGGISRFLATRLPQLCYHAAVVLFGGFAYEWSAHIIHAFRSAPEFTAIVAAFACCLGLFVVGSNQRSTSVTNNAVESVSRKNPL